MRRSSRTLSSLFLVLIGLLVGAPTSAFAATLLAMTSDGDLYEIDTTDGSNALVASHPLGGGIWSDLAYDATTHRLYGSILGASSAQATSIMQITTSDIELVASVVPNGGIGATRGLAFDETRGVFFANLGSIRLVEVDPDTGINTLVGGIFPVNQRDWIGLTYDAATDSLLTRTITFGLTTSIDPDVGDLYGALPSGEDLSLGTSVNTAAIAVDDASGDLFAVDSMNGNSLVRIERATLVQTNIPLTPPLVGSIVGVAVPEPASGSMLAVGLLAWVAVARRFAA